MNIFDQDLEEVIAECIQHRNNQLGQLILDNWDDSYDLMVRYKEYLTQADIDQEPFNLICPQYENTYLRILFEHLDIENLLTIEVVNQDNLKLAIKQWLDDFINPQVLYYVMKNLAAGNEFLKHKISLALSYNEVEKHTILQSKLVNHPLIVFCQEIIDEPIFRSSIQDLLANSRIEGYLKVQESVELIFENWDINKRVSFKQILEGYSILHISNEIGQKLNDVEDLDMLVMSLLDYAFVLKKYQGEILFRKSMDTGKVRQYLSKNTVESQGEEWIDMMTPDGNSGSIKFSAVDSFVKEHGEILLYKYPTDSHPILLGSVLLIQS